MNKQEEKKYKKSIFKEFINEYFKLLDFLKKYSDNDFTFKKFYAKNYLLKKVNIKLFIKGWYENITALYYSPIMSGNLDYFLKKDFNSDINKNKSISSEFNMNYYIDYFKGIYTTIQSDLFNKFIDYIKQLTNLSYLYYKK
jgi:hypothetical protein